MKFIRRRIPDEFRCRSWADGWCRRSGCFSGGHRDSRSWLHMVEDSHVEMWDSVGPERTIVATGGVLTITALDMACETLEHMRGHFTPFLAAVSRTLASNFPFHSFLKLGVVPDETREAAEASPYTITPFHMGPDLTPERTIGFYYDDRLPDNGILVISREGPCARVRVTSEGMI